MRFRILAPAVPGGLRDLGLRLAARVGIIGFTEQCAPQLLDDRVRNFVLGGEDVVERAVVGLGPEVGIVDCAESVRRIDLSLQRLESGVPGKRHGEQRVPNQCPAVEVGRQVDDLAEELHRLVAFARPS